MFPNFLYTSYESANRTRSLSSHSSSYSISGSGFDDSTSTTTGSLKAWHNHQTPVIHRPASVPRDFRINPSWDGLLKMFNKYYTALPLYMNVEESPIIMENMRHTRGDMPKYLLAPDGFIPNSTIRNHLKSIIPEKLTSPETKLQETSERTNLEQLVRRYLSDEQSRRGDSLASLVQASFVKKKTKQGEKPQQQPQGQKRRQAARTTSAIAPHLLPPLVDLSSVLNVDVDQLLNKPDCNQIALDSRSGDGTSTDLSTRLFSFERSTPKAGNDQIQQQETIASHGLGRAAQFQRMARELTKEKVNAYYDKIIKESRLANRRTLATFDDMLDDEKMFDDKFDQRGGGVTLDDPSTKSVRTRVPPPNRLFHGGGELRLIARESYLELMKKMTSEMGSDSEYNLTYTQVKLLLAKLTGVWGSRQQVMVKLHEALSQKAEAIERLDSFLKSRQQRIGLLRAITSLEWAFDYLSNLLGSPALLMEQLSVLLKPDNNRVVSISIRSGLKVEQLTYFCDKRKMEQFHDKFKECWTLLEQELISKIGMSTNNARIMAIHLLSDNEEARQKLEKIVPIANLDALLAAVRMCRPDQCHIQLRVDAEEADNLVTVTGYDLDVDDGETDERTTAAQITSSSSPALSQLDESSIRRQYSTQDQNEQQHQQDSLTRSTTKAHHHSSRHHRQSRSTAGERVSILAGQLPLSIVDTTTTTESPTASSAHRGDVIPKAADINLVFESREFPDTDVPVKKVEIRKPKPKPMAMAPLDKNRRKIDGKLTQRRRRRNEEREELHAQLQHFDYAPDTRSTPSSQSTSESTASMQAADQEVWYDEAFSDSFSLSNLPSFSTLDDYDYTDTFERMQIRQKQAPPDQKQRGKSDSDSDKDLLAQFERGNVYRFNADPEKLEKLISIELIAASDDKLQVFLDKLQKFSWFKAKSELKTKNNFAVATFLLLPFLQNKDDICQAEVVLIQLMRQYELDDDCIAYLKGQSTKIFDKCLTTITSVKSTLQVKKDAFVRAVTQMSILVNLGVDVMSIMKELSAGTTSTDDSSVVKDSRVKVERRKDFVSLQPKTRTARVKDPRRKSLSKLKFGSVAAPAIEVATYDRSKLDREIETKKPGRKSLSKVEVGSVTASTIEEAIYSQSKIDREVDIKKSGRKSLSKLEIGSVLSSPIELATNDQINLEQQMDIKKSRRKSFSKLGVGSVAPQLIEEAIHDQSKLYREDDTKKSERKSLSKLEVSSVTAPAIKEETYDQGKLDREFDTKKPGRKSFTKLEADSVIAPAIPEVTYGQIKFDREVDTKKFGRKSFTKLGVGSVATPAMEVATYSQSKLKQDVNIKNLKSRPSISHPPASFQSLPVKQEKQLDGESKSQNQQEVVVGMIKDFISNLDHESTETGILPPSLSLKALADSLRDSEMSDEASKLFDFIERELNPDDAESDELVERIKIQLDHGGRAGKDVPFNKMINLMSVIMTLDDSGILDQTEPIKEDGSPWVDRVKTEREKIFQALNDDVEAQLDYEQSVLEELTPVQRLIWPTIESQAEIARECCEKVAFLVSNKAMSTKLASRVISLSLVDLVDSITVLNYTKELAQEGEDVSGQRRVYQQASDLVELLSWFNFRPKQCIDDLQKFKELGESHSLLGPRTSGIPIYETYLEVVDQCRLDSNTPVGCDQDSKIKRRPLSDYSTATLSIQLGEEPRSHTTLLMSKRFVIKRMTKRVSEVKRLLSDESHRRRPESKLLQIGLRLKEGMKMIDEARQLQQAHDSDSDDERVEIQVFQTAKASIFDRRGMGRLTRGPMLGSLWKSQQSQSKLTPLDSVDPWETASTILQHKAKLGTSHLSSTTTAATLKRNSGVLSLLPNQLRRNIIGFDQLVDQSHPVSTVLAPVQIQNEAKHEAIGRNLLDDRKRKFDKQLRANEMSVSIERSISLFKRKSLRHGKLQCIDVDGPEKHRPLAMAVSPIETQVVPRVEAVRHSLLQTETLSPVKERELKSGLKVAKMDSRSASLPPLPRQKSTPKKAELIHHAHEVHLIGTYDQGVWAWLDSILLAEPSIVTKSVDKLNKQVTRQLSGGGKQKSPTSSSTTSTARLGPPTRLSHSSYISLPLFPSYHQKKSHDTLLTTRLVGDSFYQKATVKQLPAKEEAEKIVFQSVIDDGKPKTGDKVVGSLDEAIRYLRFALPPGKFARLLDELEAFPRVDHVEVLHESLEEAAKVSKLRRPLRRLIPHRPQSISPAIWHQLGMVSRKPSLVDRMHDKLGLLLQNRLSGDQHSDESKTKSHCRHASLARSGLQRQGIGIGSYLHRAELVEGIVKGCKQRESIE